MTTSARWALVVLAIAAVIVAAFAAQLRHPAGPPNPPRTGERTGVSVAPADSQALAEARRRADLPACPTGTGPGPAALTDVRVECAGTGAQVDAARTLAGRIVVLNLWAYWCTPCARELPAMAQYQQRMGARVSVLTVHQDPNAGAGLARLTELGVRLPTLQDGDRRIAAALRVPNVMPATVVLRADGSVAAILPRAFVNADEIAGAVGAALGQ